MEPVNSIHTCHRSALDMIEQQQREINRLRKEITYLVSDEYQGITNRAMDQWGKDVTRLRESLAQIKYEYEQAQDDKVAYRMYKEACKALSPKEDTANE